MFSIARSDREVELATVERERGGERASTKEVTVFKPGETLFAAQFWRDSELPSAWQKALSLRG
jgi:hypothetical protein